ncbi:reverse transcriptase domain-containing protein [Tanacetum coccineum]
MAPRGRPTRTTRSRPVTATPPPVTTTPPPVTDPTTTTSVTNAQLQAMIDEGVTAVLAARATTRNGDDSHTSGTGARRNERTIRECTYQDFMKCQPLFFKGTEGVVSLTQWFERMETVFRISNCTVENQVKFATCTLMGTALTWWNSHARTVTNEVAYAMTWSDLKKKMTTKYCPRNEIKKIEVELWNLKVQGTDVVAYNQRFQELALLSDRMFPEETDKIERYVGGMPDSIYSSEENERNKQDNEEHLKIILELLKKEELYAKFSKCEFGLPKCSHSEDMEALRMVPVYGFTDHKSLQQILIKGIEHDTTPDVRVASDIRLRFSYHQEGKCPC